MKRPFLQSSGEEIACYFDTTRRCLVSVRSVGVRQSRHFNGRWQLLSRKLPNVSLEEWTRQIMAMVDSLEPWQRKVRTLPTAHQLASWEASGMCKTPTGHTVEPDGVGPDGVPSWLRLLGFI